MATFPEPTTLVYPVDGGTYLPLALTLEWNAAPGTNSYILIFNGGAEEDLGDVTTHAVSGLSPGTAQSWQIIPYNIYGRAQGCPTWGFTTLDTVPPPATTLVSPADGELGVGYGTLPIVRLEWNAAPTATGYKLKFKEEDRIDLGNVLSYEQTGLAYLTYYDWQIIPYNEYGEQPDCPVWYFTTTSEFVPNPTTVVHPTDAETGVEVMPLLQWAVEPSATGYLLNFNEYGFTDLGNVTEYQVDWALDYLTQYTWQVVPYNFNGYAEGYPTWSFTTMEMPVPPDNVTRLNPTDDSTVPSGMVSFEWTAAPRADNYTLTLGKVGFGGSSTILGNVTTCEVELLDNALYEWRIVPSNGGGIPEPDTLWNFTVLDLPGPTTVINPTDAETGVEILPLLQWDAEPSATGYLIGDSGYYMDVGNVTEWQVPGPLDYGTTYAWSVVPYNDAGTAEGCPEWSFTTMEAPLVPDPTTPVNPTDSETDVSIDVTLEWAAASGATGYMLAFNGGSPETDLGNVLEYALSALEYETTYTWQIIPYNEAGDAENCPTWSFVTMSEPIPVPASTTLIAPSDGGNARVNATLQWEAVADATGYYLILDGESPTLDLGNVTEYVTDELEYNTEHTWQVIPYNEGGEAENCPIWTFDTDLLMLSPVDGADNMSLTPMLSWDAISGAAGYYLYINDEDAVDVGDVTEYRVKRVQKLAYGTTYTWYIEPYY